MMTPTTSLNNLRSFGSSPRKASSISVSVYDEELNLDTGPSPVPIQCPRTFSNRASSIKWTADRCGVVSFNHRLTTCGVTPSLEATVSADMFAANIEAFNLKPNVDNFCFLKTEDFRINGFFNQDLNTKVSGLFGRIHKSSPLRLPLSAALAARVAAFFICKPSNGQTTAHDMQFVSAVSGTPFANAHSRSFFIRAVHAKHFLLFSSYNASQFQ